MNEYEKQLEKISQQYQRVYFLINEKLSGQIDPFIASYDKDIQMLNDLYRKNIQHIRSEERSSLLETLFKEENVRYLRLLDECSPYVKASKDKLKELNKKLRLAHEYILLKG